MAAAGLCGTKRVLHGKAPLPGFVACLLTCDEIVVHDRPMLGPNAARRTKVRNAALGGDTGAGKWNNFSGSGDHIAEPLNSTRNIFCDHRIAPNISGSPGSPFCNPTDRFFNRDAVPDR